jgi:hypothetical protein
MLDEKQLQMRDRIARPVVILPIFDPNGQPP